MRVAIFGAGVGGLSIAHHLMKAGAHIDIYEREGRVGGLARSEGSATDTREISWRVYFSFYEHVFRLMSEIPDGNGGKVIDHLVVYNACRPGIGLLGGFWGALDRFKSVAQIVTASDERLDSWDKYTWFQRADVDMQVPQWLGLDRFKASYEAVARIGIEQSFLKFMKDNYVLDGPTSEVWFTPWASHLEKNGVKFHFNSPVESVTTTGARLSNGTEIDADIYILAVPIEVLAEVTTLVPRAHELSLASRQIQLAYQLYFAQPMHFGTDENPMLSVILGETPWGLIIEDKAASWSLPCAPWSVTVCQADVPGPLTGKPLMRCTKDEAFDEIMYQIHSDKGLMRLLHRNNLHFVEEALSVTRWNTMDDTYFFSPSGMQTSEPKFSNNAGTLKLRPNFKIADNVYISTAYTQETIDIFSMEAAARSAAFVIADITRTQPPKELPRAIAVLSPVRKLDWYLYRVHAPPLITIALMLFVSYIVYRILVTLYPYSE